MKSYHPVKVFTAACLGMFLFGIVFLSLGTLSPFLQTKFSLTAEDAATLASFLPLGMLAGTLIFGPVADRYGYKYLLAISTLVIAMALEMIAFAPTLRVLQGSFFVIGISGGSINGATNALVADIAGEHKGANLSLLGVFFGIGALGMPVLMGILTKIWRYETILAVIGWIILLSSLYFLLIRFPVPKQKQGFPIRQGLALLREPFIILAGLILFFESGLEGMVSNWTTTYLAKGDFAKGQALFALSFQVAGLVVARLILAGLLRKMAPASLFTACLLLLVTGSLVLYFSSSFLPVILAMILIGFGFAAGFPVMLGFVGEKYPSLSGTAFSVVIIMALIGNTLLNYLTGFLSKTVGIRFFPLLLVVCALVMLVLLQVVRRLRD